MWTVETKQQDTKREGGKEEEAVLLRPTKPKNPNFEPTGSLLFLFFD